MKVYTNHDTALKFIKKLNYIKLLKDFDITGEEYHHTKTIWKDINISNMTEYHDSYLTKVFQ